MSRAKCLAEACDRPAMSALSVAAKLGNRLYTGLCPLHTVRAVVMARAQVMGAVSATNHDPAPLAEWVAAVRSSACMTVARLTVHDVTLAELADVTGVAPKTLTGLAHGTKTYVHTATRAKLMPWVDTVDPTPRGQVLQLGKLYGPNELARAPLGVTAVDSRGRAWQLRGKADRPTWCPAHLKRTDTPASLDNGPAWPVRVVYTPARMATRTTF